MREKKAYLAGPEVFLPNAVEIGRRKKALCAEYGIEGLYPFDNEVPAVQGEDDIDVLIYAANVRMIREADFGIFNLTPFRGPSADVGTVFELGMLTGIGKPAFAYTNDNRDFLERCRQFWPVQLNEGIWRDSNQWSVENFGNADNLMIDAALRQQGHPIIRHVAPPDALVEDLAGFEQCLKFAVGKLDAEGGSHSRIRADIRR